MKTVVTAVVASVIAILPATATPKGEPAPAPTPAASTAAVEAPVAAKRYCYDTELTGSRITKRVCHTRTEWKELGVKVPDGL